MLLLWCGGAMGGSSADEFPLLSALGLYAADIRGDGELLQPVPVVVCRHAAFGQANSPTLLITLPAQATVSSTPSPIRSMAPSPPTPISVPK